MLMMDTMQASAWWEEREREKDGGFVGASNLLCNCLCQKQRERERVWRRLGQTFGALITSMRKCFKCDRSQKRRACSAETLSKAVSTLHCPHALSLSLTLSCSLSLSASFLRHLCAMASRRHFVFRITMEHGMRKVTACCGKSFDVGAEENA